MARLQKLLKSQELYFMKSPRELGCWCCGFPGHGRQGHRHNDTWPRHLPHSKGSLGQITSHPPQGNEEMGITPWKINMEPKHGGLEDDFPFQLGDFWVLC